MFATIAIVIVLNARDPRNLSAQNVRNRGEFHISVESVHAIHDFFSFSGFCLKLNAWRDVQIIHTLLTSICSPTKPSTSATNVILLVNPALGLQGCSVRRAKKVFTMPMANVSKSAQLGRHLLT